MPHFLALPEKKYPQTPDPNFRSLSLYDKNGTAALGVWAANPDWKVKAASNPRFLAEPYRTNGDVVYFMLRGLVAGDKIAAFDEAGLQQTAWLDVKYSAGDRGAAVIRKSHFFSRVTLDARGSNQGHYPMREEDWLDWVERCLGKIKENPVGKVVMTHLSSDVTIYPFLENQKNAFSDIRFTPSIFGSDFRPGARPNEILFHELCHTIDGLIATYTDNPAIPFLYDKMDFFTVTATNVYCSAIKRPLRHDHKGFVPLKPAFDGAGGQAVFLTAVKSNFDLLKAKKPALYTAIGGVSAPWNPFSPSVTPIPVGP